MYADVRKLHSMLNDFYVSLYSARYSLLGTPKYNYITKLGEYACDSTSSCCLVPVCEFMM
jgi:hypothetical protein